MRDRWQVLQAAPILERHACQNDRCKEQPGEEPEPRSKDGGNRDRNPCRAATTFEPIAGQEVGHDVAPIERDDRNQVKGAPTKRREEPDPEKVPNKVGLVDDTGAPNAKNYRSEHDPGEWSREANEDRLRSARGLLEAIAGEPSHTFEADRRRADRSLGPCSERVAELVDEHGNNRYGNKRDHQVELFVEGDEPEKTQG